MGPEEYLLSMLEWSAELDEEFSDEDIDNIDFTIRSIVSQMGWQAHIVDVRNLYDYS